MIEFLFNFIPILIAIAAILCCITTAAQIILELYERNDDDR